MFAARRSQRHAFSLVELMLVIAMGVVLLALLISAIQLLRESANRTRCQNNLRQLALAVQHFHDEKGSLPTYCGIYPAVRDNVRAEANPLRVYGGWFAHLLPFVGEGDLHQLIEDEVRQGQRNTTMNSTRLTAASGRWVPPVAGTPDRWDPPRRQVIVNPGAYQWMPVQQQNGYTVLVQQLVGQTWVWEPPDAVFTAGKPARPGHWDPPGSGPQQLTVCEPHGIWLPETKGQRFAQLICPSDPSPGADPEAGQGLVYIRSHSPPWGGTNYLANWWALAGTDLKLGWLSPPQTFATITDGLSGTILFAEGYSWCDGIGRIALYPPNQHNFGLSQALPHTQCRVEVDGQTFTVGSHEYGYPNTWMFQIRPLARPVDRCPPGGRCCNRWTAQSGHTVMNVALMDGSVRTLSAGLAPDTWRRALQPRDGEGQMSDW